MINLKKGQSNVVVVTLKEKQTTDPCKFLFEFKSQADKASRFVFAEDVSEHVERYNQFTISLTDGDPLEGHIELEAGMHDYVVHQIADASLTPDSPDVILEQGLVLVIGDMLHPKTYSRDVQTKTWKG